MTTTFQVVNGDVVIGHTGQTNMVTGSEKFSQDVHEMAGTAVRVDNIGAGLDEIVGEDGDASLLRNRIFGRLSAAVRTMVSLQRRFHWRRRPKNERIFKITRVNVYPVKNKKTAFAFSVDFQTEDLSTTPVSGEIS